jgi:hypothetical protein
MNTVVKWTTPCPPLPKKMTFEDVSVGEWFMFVEGACKNKLFLKIQTEWFAPVEKVHGEGFSRQFVSPESVLNRREVKLVDVVIHATKRD